VDLPKDIVQEFKGNAISLTGFEVDVLNENNNSIPEFLVYNHHYCATLLGSSSQMVKIGSRQQDSLLRDDQNRFRRRAFEVHPPEWEPRDVPSMTDLLNTFSSVPTAHNFWQGNGGEHRKSFKHLPEGTGQLLESPTSFVLQPMLINTNFQNHTSNMECPCTTRTVKIITGYTAASKGTCNESIIANEAECFDAVASLLGRVEGVVKNVTETSSSSPPGCYIIAHTNGNEAYFNMNVSSKVACGDTSSRAVRSKGTASSSSNNLKIHLDLDQASQNTTITLIGPSDVWFGVGFGAHSMGDMPYTIIVDGSGAVSERKLANHMPVRAISLSLSLSLITLLTHSHHVQGSELNKTIEIISNTVTPKSHTRVPKRMNREGGIELKSNVDVERWSECREHCDEDLRCSSWRYTPNEFSTPYNLQVVGTCTTYGDDGNKSSSFTSVDWVEGMLSDVKPSKDTTQNIRTVVLRRSLKGLLTCESENVALSISISLSIYTHIHMSYIHIYIGQSKDYYTFDPRSNGIPLIEAVGTTSDFQYHGKSRGGMNIILVEVGAPVCVCKSSSLGGSINGIPWANNCEAWPATTILRDHNPSCSIDTYEGGMTCCHHGM